VSPKLTYQICFFTLLSAALYLGLLMCYWTSAVNITALNNMIFEHHSKSVARFLMVLLSIFVFLPLGAVLIILFLTILVRSDTCLWLAHFHVLCRSYRYLGCAVWKRKDTMTMEEVSVSNRPSSGPITLLCLISICNRESLFSGCNVGAFRCLESIHIYFSI
jgi:hypothetical protein